MALSNHIHMLIQVSDAPLGRIILRVASPYARGVQAELSTTGHLFERRYHAVLVDADEYLLCLPRAHMNPVRAGMVNHPADYPWSSHHVYLGSREEPWVTTTFALGMLDADLMRAIAAYRRLVEGDADGEASPLVGLNPTDARVLGSDSFLARVMKETSRPPSRMTLEALIHEVCVEFSVEVGTLLGPARQRHLTRVRARIAHQALQQRIASLCEVARALNRSESALRECVLRHHPPG